MVLVLNPAELLKQARDSTRVSDLAKINKELSLYQTDQSTGSLGNANTIYVSLPDDASAGCATYLSAGTLPAAPSGYTYHCANKTNPDSNYQLVNGTGWVPVNFSSISYGSPLGTLPVDPSQNAASGLYYTYTTNASGQWELTALFESQKYRIGGSNDKASTDGGNSNELYEAGSNLTLNPLNDNGLVGWWKFDEGAGTSAKDSSGNGITGTWNGTGSHWTTGKVGAGAGQFAVSTLDYVLTNNSTSFNFNRTDKFTVTAWINTTDTTHHMSIAGNNTGTVGWAYFVINRDAKALGMQLQNSEGYMQAYIPQSTVNTSDGNWHFVVGVYDGSSAWTGFTFYIDGQLRTASNGGSVSSLISSVSSANALALGNYGGGSTLYFNGSLDDIRVYNRALSAAEITAIYNATK